MKQPPFELPVRIGSYLRGGEGLEAEDGIVEAFSLSTQVEREYIAHVLNNFERLRAAQAVADAKLRVNEARGADPEHRALYAQSYDKAVQALVDLSKELNKE